VKQDFLGFTDANGKASNTIFRKAFTEGGVFLLDEVDNGNANVGVALNAPLENKIAAFPDMMADAHEDFICVGAMNTNGRGGTTQYAARNRQDEAFLDRFVFLEWNIDERFEMDIASNKDWCKRIQSLRARVKTLGIDFHIGTRATFQGEKIIAAGFAESDALASAVFKGLSQNQIDQILN
jgi:galactokinase